MRKQVFYPALALTLFFCASAYADTSALTSTPTNAAIALPPYQFPALVDSEVPDSILNASDSIATDMPKPYKDRCHVQQNLVASKSSCLYGNLASKRTIVLFGDSHALSWFPAFEKLAITKKWRLVSLTMSSCWPANIPAWNPVTNILMNNCTIWRKSALKQITQLKPYMTVVTGTRGFATVDSSGTVLQGDARVQAWRTGMATTLKIIKAVSSNTVMLSDTPISTSTFPECLIGSPTSIQACSTPVATAIDIKWLTVEKNLAQSQNIIWVNPTEWICNTDPCSPIMDNYLIYRDGGHLTASFATRLEKPLWSEISSELTP